MDSESIVSGSNPEGIAKIMNKQQILDLLKMDCQAYFQDYYQYQKWLKDTDWQKYRYIGIDACQGCKSLFTHKPRLKKYGTNYLWERKWYQLKIFGCQATQIDICSDQRDKELEDIQLKPEDAKLIDLHALVLELAQRHD